MTEEALRILASPSPSAYSRALAALREDTRDWWQDQLSWAPEDYDEEQKPYRADAESLKRFLGDETKAAPRADLIVFIAEKLKPLRDLVADEKVMGSTLLLDLLHGRSQIVPVLFPAAA
jgi:hypothetical protein